MNNTEAIKNLKKSLDSIYENFRTRIDENAWKTVIKPAYEADKTETSIIVTDFLQTHSYMPVSCLHSICDAIDLKNSPAQMANIFGVKTIERLFENMTVRSPINYDYIPDSCDENQIKSIVDTAREVRKLVNNSQQYLASLEIEKLQQLCPEHPDVLDMQNDIASLYTGMVEKLRQLVNANNKKEEYELEIKKTEKEADIIMEQGGVSKVISFYENIIFEKPSFSFAHFELGKLHLKTGQYSRALHLADILFERPEDKTEAYILKGMVMEELSKYEDALFYYSSAYRSDTKNTEAYNCKQRLLGILDGKSAMDFCDQRSDINEIKAEKNITKNIKSSDNFKDIGYTLNAIEEMIGKGRFSQAYYEIRRVTFGRNEHEILAFLDAFILYMLNKEKEARDLFKKLSNSNIFGNLAVYMIDDIDRKIVDEGIFDGMSEEDTAAIYFN